MSESDKAGTVFDAEEVVKKTVNSNGQVYLGRNLGGKEVRVAYEVVGDDTDPEE